MHQNMHQNLHMFKCACVVVELLTSVDYASDTLDRARHLLNANTRRSLLIHFELCLVGCHFVW